MAQQVQVELIGKDRASKEIQGVANTLERMKISVETNRTGLNKLDNALKDSAANMLGLQGSAGRLADALLEFAPAGYVGGAVIAGIMAIAYAFNKQQERQKELVEANANSAIANENLRLSYIRLGSSVEDYSAAVLQSTINIAQSNVQKSTEELANYFNKLNTEAKSLARTTLMALAKSRGRTGAAGITPEAIQREEQKQLQMLLRITAAERIKLETDVAQKVTDLNNAIAAKRETDAERARKLAETTAAARKKLDAETAKEAEKLAKERYDAAVKHFDDVEKAYFDSLKRQEENEKNAFDERNRLQQAAARYNIYLTEQAFASEKKLTDEQITLIKKRIEEEQAKLAYFALQGNADAIIAASNALAKLQEDAVKQMQQTSLFTGIELGVNALADGFNAMGAAIATGANALNAFGKAAKQAIGQSLQILGREQLVKGLANLASGFAAAALGPIGGKSSKDFFKAAGFNFAAASLAGFAGGALGGSSGGGGVGGGAFSNSQLGQNNFSTQQPLTIVVQGGLLDMSNPETQRSFVSAMETVSNRRVRMVGA